MMIIIIAFIDAMAPYAAILPLLKSADTHYCCFSADATYAIDAVTLHYYYDTPSSSHYAIDMPRCFRCRHFYARC